MKISTAGNSSQPLTYAATPPVNVATAMPTAAKTTAVTRVREAPWKDTIPAGSAPRAA